MWRRVGLQLLLVSHPPPGPHNPERFETFCRDNLFAGKMQLDVPAFLQQLDSVGCNGESLGADLRTLLRCTVVRVADDESSLQAGYVDVEHFMDSLLDDFDCQRYQRWYEEARKLTLDRLSACLVQHCPSLARLDLASPAAQLEEVANLFKTALYKRELQGMVGMVTMKDFANELATLGCHAGTLGPFCMDILLTSTVVRTHSR